MKRIKNMLNNEKVRKSVGIVPVLCGLILSIVLLSGCATKNKSIHPVSVDNTAEAVDEAFVNLLETGNVSLAEDAPTLIKIDDNSVVNPSLSSGVIAPSQATAIGTAAYLHFSDPDSCIWNPNICNNSFTLWPGYIQNFGGSTWGYVWMSYGPGGELIPNGTGKHYHIVGMFNSSIEPNPKHSAMFGNEWLAVVMKNNGGLTNFDLTEIKVKNDTPIQLWFKDAENKWWWWQSIGPGWWSLPGATNIQEVHITSASRNSSDQYSVDDIRVQAR